MSKLTIIDIARMANTSVSTVSRVLNNQDEVSPKTRKRVLAVIEKTTYIPNNSARNLKRQSLKAIAVIVKGFTNPLFTSMLYVIQRAIEQQHYEMLLEPVETSQNEVEVAISLCKEKKPRGLVFMGGNFEHSRAKLEQLDVPFVMLTTTLRQSKDSLDPACYSSVSIDDFRVSYDLTARLYDAGHRHFAMIGPAQDDRSIGSLRLAGFLQALEDRGIGRSDVKLAYCDEFMQSAGYEAASELLGQGDFTCLVCVADRLAMGALRAFHDAGRRVPEDISVVGFDGLNDGCYTIPALATVKQPDKVMARRSVELLFDHILEDEPHQHLTFEPEFVSRESCRALTKEDM